MDYMDPASPNKQSSVLHRLRHVPLVESFISFGQQIWSAINALGGPWKIVAGVVTFGGTAYAYVIDNLAVWQACLLLSVAFLIWTLAGYLRKKSQAVDVPSFDISDVKAFGDELAKFSDDALMELRHFIREYPNFYSQPGEEDSVTSRRRWNYDKDRRGDLTRFFVTKFGGKVQSYFLRLRAFGVEPPSEVMFQAMHDPNSLLMLLSQVGHAMKAGGLSEVRSITQNDTWRLTSLTAGLQ